MSLTAHQHITGYTAYSKHFLITHTHGEYGSASLYRVSGAEPPAGVQGAEPPVGGQGAKPPEADEAFVFKTVIFNGFAAVLHEMMYNLYFLTPNVKI